MGDESQVEGKGLAAELQIVWPDFIADLLKLETDFHGFQGWVPVERQQVKLLQKSGDFLPPLRPGD